MRKFTFCIVLIFLFTKLAQGQCNGSFGQCSGTETFTSDPPPVNGYYPAGTTVTFCYTISSFELCNSNWLHTIQIDLGEGWDSTTLTPISVPESCDGEGNWAFYTSTTSVNTGLSFGPCFAYDSPEGNPTLVLDGIPGNNYGDNCSFYSWTFCFSVQSIYGCDQGSLNLEVTAIGDGTSGAWGTNVCPGVPFPISTALCTQCPISVAGTVLAPTCQNNDGSIALTVDSAIGQASYSWFPGGEETPAIDSLSSGTYIVNVTDSFGCLVADTFELAYVNNLEINSITNPVSCSGNCDGLATIIASGGETPYAYSWSNGITDSITTTLCPGEYSVTVTDANNCQGFEIVVVDNIDSLAVTVNTTDPTCFNYADGSASVVATGGNGGYSYLWLPGYQGGNVISGLASGTFAVQVTDALGCFSSLSFVIENPLPMLAIADFTNPLCFGESTGAAFVSVDQGQPPYQFLWLPSLSASDSAVGLAPGIHTVLVMDANGCFAGDTIVLTEPAVLSGEFTVEPSSCLGAKNGSINLNMTGGIPPYHYFWNGSAIEGDAFYTNLQAGIYSVEVADANHCSLVLYSEIVSNNELIVEAGDNVTIEAGTGVQLSATVNRAGNFLYQWMPEEDFENPLTSDPFVKPQKTITYRVMVTEENTNCSATDSLQVKVLPPGYLLFPSAFTPNGDGLNDVFFPVAEGLYLVTIERFAVYNRWGNLLHNNPSVGWDGTVGGLPEEMGTYVYEITYRVAGEQERISTRGNLTLLR